MYSVQYCGAEKELKAADLSTPGLADVTLSHTV